MIRIVDPLRFPFLISSDRMPSVPRLSSRWGGLQIRVGRFDSGSRLQEFAAVAQLVERNLAKVEVESSRLFCRSSKKKGKAIVAFPFSYWGANIIDKSPGGEIGRHKRLKISRPLAIRVRPPSRAPIRHLTIPRHAEEPHAHHQCDPMAKEKAGFPRLAFFSDRQSWRITSEPANNPGQR